MKLQKINENNLVVSFSYGLRSDDRTLTISLLGDLTKVTYAELGFNISLTKNMGVIGGSQLKFLSVEEAEKFNTAYYKGQLQIVRSRYRRDLVRIDNDAIVPCYAAVEFIANNKNIGAPNNEYIASRLSSTKVGAPRNDLNPFQPIMDAFDKLGIKYKENAKSIVVDCMRVKDIKIKLKNTEVNGVRIALKVTKPDNVFVATGAASKEVYIDNPMDKKIYTDLMPRNCLRINNNLTIYPDTYYILVYSDKTIHIEPDADIEKEIRENCIEAIMEDVKSQFDAQNQIAKDFFYNLDKYVEVDI